MCRRFYEPLSDGNAICLELRAKVLEYLKLTENIGGMVEKLPARDPSSGISSWILAPWSVEALKQNLCPNVSEEIRRMEADGILELHQLMADGEPVQMIRNPKLGSVNSSNSISADMKRTVSGIMNLHILSYIQDRQKITDKPVKLEEALFDLKNGVMLPDDFMPVYLMGNIEGSETQVEPCEIAREIQPFNDVAAIFCYFEHSSQRTGTLAMLYAATNFIIPLTREEMRKKLADSFRKLQEYPDYGDFEMSRILNQIIFNREKRHTDELRRPYPKQEYISRLMELEIVQKMEERYLLNPEMPTEKIKQIRDELKKKASVLAASWLNWNLI